MVNDKISKPENQTHT